MNTPDIIINFVLDESASMSGRRQQTISAANEYISGMRADAKEKEQHVLFSLTIFNTSTRVVHAAEDIQNVPDITQETYTPSGGTALLDAIGITVETIASKVDEHKWRPAILCVVMTDGEENSSGKFSNEDIEKLIAAKEKEGNWTFVYLGADKEAWHKGASYGFAKSRSVGYDAENMVGTMSALRSSTKHFMGSVDTDHEVYGSADFFAGTDDALFRNMDLDEKDDD